MGSVYLRGKTYWIKFKDERGRLVRKSAKTSDLETARAFLVERQASAPETPSGPLFEDLSKHYLRHLRAHGKTASVQSAESAVRSLTRLLPRKPVPDLTPSDLDHFIQQRRRKVAASSVNGDLRILKAVLNRAVEERRIDALPFRIRLLKSPRKRAVPILSDGDIRTLLDHAEEPYRSILLVCASTGMRVDEVLHLTWSDLDAEASQIHVTAKDGWSPKSHQERSLPVSTSLLDHLRTLPKTRRSPYVFASRAGTARSVTNVLRVIREVFRDAGLYREGLPLTHRLRHTAASKMLGNGVDLETVRRFLGHADASTTLLYAQTTDERMRSAANVLCL